MGQNQACFLIRRKRGEEAGRVFDEISWNGLRKTKEEVFSILEGTLMIKGKHADHFNGEGRWIQYFQ